jgi:hypothetical protein
LDLCGAELALGSQRLMGRLSRTRPRCVNGRHRLRLAVKRMRAIN